MLGILAKFARSAKEQISLTVHGPRYIDATLMEIVQATCRLQKEANRTGHTFDQIQAEIMNSGQAPLYTAFYKAPASGEAFQAYLAEAKKNSARNKEGATVGENLLAEVQAFVMQRWQSGPLAPTGQQHSL